MTLRRSLVICLLLCASFSLVYAQGLDPASIPFFAQRGDAWPTYNGDYSGRRYSPLSRINASNVDQLTLAWMYRIPGVGQQRGVGEPTIKSTPLMVNGILYFTIPDHVYALNARTGELIWQYAWEDKGGHLIGQRGVGLYRDYVYFLAPDGWFISLNAKDGSERWRKKVADEKLQYFTTSAAVIVKNHVIIGVGGDAMDVRGFLESRDPETGALLWRWNTTPQAPGQPGAETWPDEYSMTHGGGMPWLPGTYDPELNLYYFGTGNPNPVLAGQSREGDNLYTCSIVAINPDTGKMAWYYQVTPHDTHDWDAAQTPVLIDAVFQGRPRKLVAQANRNGHFVLLDRVTGEHLLTTRFIDSLNWTKAINAKGQPIRNPSKDASVPGTLVSPDTTGATNWPPPSFSPDTGLFYFGARQTFSVMYLTDTDGRPQGWAAAEHGLASVGNALDAIDYQTGKIKWSRALAMGPGGSLGNAMGLLSTAGGLLFGNDGGGNFVAYDASTGKPLWHAGLGTNTSNGPQTYLLDGRQHVVVGAGDTLYAFALQP